MNNSIDKEDQRGYIRNLKELAEKAGNKYALINILAKRVHQILEENVLQPNKLDYKQAILQALKEFEENKLFYKKKSK
jgi:DNA-directed RNA polymerase subunit K/omega